MKIGEQITGLLYDDAKWLKTDMHILYMKSLKTEDIPGVGSIQTAGSPTKTETG